MVRHTQYEASYQEQRLWLEWLKKPKSIAYHIPVYFFISQNKKINLKKILISLKKIIARHKNLRANFIQRDGKLSKVIYKNIRLDHEEIDLNTYTKREAELKFQEILHEKVYKPFDLSRCPLLRYIIIKVPEGGVYLVFVLHHIIVDALSVQTIFSELSKLYKNEELPPLMERSNFKLETINKNFWRAELKDFSSNLQLPKSYENKNFKFNGVRKILKVSLFQTKEINKILGHYEITLFTLISSIVSLILHKYVRKDTITFNYLKTQRQPNQMQEVGFFANIIPYKIFIDKTETFENFLIKNKKKKELLEKNKINDISEVLEISNNEGLPFPISNIWINQPYSFNFQLNLLDKPINALLIKKFKAQNDLTINFDSSKNIIIEFEYNRNNIDNLFIKNFINDFNLAFKSLKALLFNPLEDFSLSPNTKLQKRYENRYVGLAQLIERRCRENPQRTALIFKNKKLTYKELAEKIHYLAHCFKSANLKQNDRVCVYLEHSLESVIVILTLLMAGYTYIPLDPFLPEGRLNNIIESCNPKVIITRKQNFLRFKKYNSILIDPHDKENYSSFPINWSRISRNAEAYIIFTSGSSGKPKGVVITHQALVKKIFSIIKAYNISKKEIYLHYSSYSFDASLEEILPTLIKGGSVIIADSKEKFDKNYITSLIKTHHITSFSIVPTAMHYLLFSFNKQNTRACSSLKKIILGGERADSALVNLCWEIFPKIQILNTYGPTETCIVVTSHICTSLDKVYPPLIGLPLKDSHIFILNEKNDFLPNGAIGEIAIGGTCVAKHYLGFSNKDKFIYINGKKLYKTGDLGRKLFQDKLEFLGRIDRQIKLHGFRIELEEIEKTVSSYPKVKQCVVVLHSCNETNLNKLLAFILVEFPGEKLENDIKQYLEYRLPHYMIPSHILSLESFPVTINGKIDILALMKLGNNFFKNSQKVYSNHINIKNISISAKIASQVLGKEYIDIKKNFFQLGGNSLLALRFILEAERYGSSISLKDIYNMKSIEELDEIIKNEDQKSPRPRFSRATSSLPVSPFQENLFKLAEKVPEKNFHAEITLKIKGKICLKALDLALNAIVEKHVMLRSSFKKVGDNVKQDIHPYKKFNLKIVQINKASLEEYLINISREKFSLSKGKVFKFIVCMIEKNKYYLFISFHHIIIDAWSMDLFFQELTKNYDQFIKTPDINESFKSLNQIDFFKLNMKSKEPFYFKPATPHIKRIKIFNEKNKKRSFSGQSFYFPFNQKLSQKVTQFCATYLIAPSAIGLSAYQIFLYLITEQKEFSILIPTLHRPSYSALSTIGYFIKQNLFSSHLDESDNFLTITTASKVELKEMIDPHNSQKNASEPLFYNEIIHSCDAVYVYQNAQQSKPIIGESEITVLSSFKKMYLYNFCLEIFDSNNVITGIKFEINDNILEILNINMDFLGFFLKLLEELIDNPLILLKEISKKYNFLSKALL
jgi:amino acid adenylation domain-containing protein